MKDRKDIIQGEKSCSICGKNLSDMRITDVGNHIKWCKFRNNPDNRYSQSTKKGNITRFGQYRQYIVTCDKCGKEFNVVQRQKLFPKQQKYFCSSSCSHSRDMKKHVDGIWSPQKRKEYSEQSKLLWENEEYSKRLLNNNKYFTSKGERLIRDYIIQTHPDDNWTWGCLNKRYKQFVFNPDMFSHILKIVFQYDGECHFKDIYPNRDFQKGKNKQKLLQQWCVTNGYKLLRITESWFNSINKDVSLVQNLLYSLDKSITKLGIQYYIDLTGAVPVGSTN